MGTWGWGNLESDGAQDTLAGICTELFDQVVKLLQHPRAHEYDDVEIDELFVRIEMIFALYDRGMINTSPKPEELESLFVPYLQRWADYSRRAGVEPPAERRSMIENSFAKLLEIASKACGGSFEHRIALIMDVMSKPSSDADTSHR